MENQKMENRYLYRILVLGIILTLIYSWSFSFTIASINGFVLAIFLAWFISKVDLKPGSTFILVWFSLFMIGGFNNFLEAYFFTKQFNSIESFMMAILISLFNTLLQSISAILLLQPNGRNDITTALKSYESSRTRSSWMKRIIAASVLFFPIYFTFGAMVSPFVVPYYSQPSSGLIIPSFKVMIPLELLRGVIYTAVLLIVLACIKSERRLDLFVSSALLYIPGAFIPLISVASISFMSPVAPYHMVEIFADSVVYGYAASHLITKKSV